MAPPHVLPDVLRPGLQVVFCGSAAGAVSAARGAYYAGPGNKLWRILAEVGLTPRRLEPGEVREVLNFGIGLTDLVKTHSGSDAVLPRAADDVAGLIARIRSVRPRPDRVHGKRAAASVLWQIGPRCRLRARPASRETSRPSGCCLRHRARHAGHGATRRGAGSPTRLASPATNSRFSAAPCTGQFGQCLSTRAAANRAGFGILRRIAADPFSAWDEITAVG